jgi:hypothetical protein
METAFLRASRPFFETSASTNVSYSFTNHRGMASDLNQRSHLQENIASPPPPSQINLSVYLTTVC